MTTVAVDTPCVEWDGAKQSEGYGHRTVDKRQVLVHKANWEALHGPVPEGLELDHLCGNRACVNPAHLEPVTHAVNIRRGRSTTLTQPDVDRIRARRAQGETCVRIAASYGISAVSVSGICLGRRWA